MFGSSSTVHCFHPKITRKREGLSQLVRLLSRKGNETVKDARATRTPNTNGKAKKPGKQYNKELKMSEWLTRHQIVTSFLSLSDDNKRRKQLEEPKVGLCGGFRSLGMVVSDALCGFSLAVRITINETVPGILRTNSTRTKMGFKCHPSETTLGNV